MHKTLREVPDRISYDDWTPPPDAGITPEALQFAEVLRLDTSRPHGGLLEHAKRVVDNAVIFVRGKRDIVPRDLAEAALLHDVFGRMVKGGEFSEQISEAYLLYSLGPNVATTYGELDEEARTHQATLHAHQQRVLRLLTDQVLIGETAREYRRDAKKYAINNELGEEQEPELQFLQKIDNELQEPLEVKWWNYRTEKIHWDKMYKLCKKVHIESPYIKGNEMLDNLKYPPAREAAQLHDIFEAESFYMPLLKELGYDALVMEMDSTCKIRRLRGLGEHEAIQSAVEAYRYAETIDPTEIIKEMFGLDEAPQMQWIVNESSDDIEHGKNCRMGEMIVELPLKTGQSQKEKIRIKFRQKSIGSIAHKQVSAEAGYRMMDIFGFTVVSGKEAFENDVYSKISESELQEIINDQQAKLQAQFGLIASNAINNPNVELIGIKGGRQGIYCQGQTEFIEGIKNSGSLDSISPDQITFRTIDEDDVYQVAKCTGIMNGVPTEIQCTTGYVLQISRSGILSHALYKSGSKEKLSLKQRLATLKDIAKIHGRRHYLGDEGCNKRSETRANMARRCIFTNDFRDWQDRE